MIKERKYTRNLEHDKYTSKPYRKEYRKLKKLKSKMKNIDKKQSIRIGKYIAKLLRHDPEELDMDSNGWVSVKSLLNKLKISKHDLDYIVSSDDKQRYDYNGNHTKIRANQGHSIKGIDLNLTPEEPPEFLYHGTPYRNVSSILKEGLKKGKRNHIHLSKDIETATDVGLRYCKKEGETPYIFKIPTRRMYEDGVEFYVSKNGVWLVDYINPKYLKNEI